MLESAKPAKASRRNFLKLAGASAAGGAGIAALSTPASATQIPQDTKSDKNVGYRETEHVKTYYKTARF